MNICLTYIVSLFTGTVLMAQTISFTEVSDSVGISYDDKGWAVTWCDANGDGWQDLFSSNHWSLPSIRPASLYLGDSLGFTELNFDYTLPIADGHGSAWADFDNDGDQDLIVLTGRDFETLLRVNLGDTAAVNLATEYGLNVHSGRGRMPIWIDVDNDGLLDLANCNANLISGADIRSAVYRQRPDSSFFELYNSNWNFEETSAVFGLPADIDGDNKMELLLSLKDTIRIYKFSDLGFQVELNIDQGGIQDIIAEDLDGDLLNDIYIARNKKGSTIEFAADSALIAKLDPYGSEEGFVFKTKGDIRIQLDFVSQIFADTVVYIGATGIQPSSAFDFTLSSTDTLTHGVFPHIPGVDNGFYVGYDSSDSNWVFLYSTDPVSTSTFVSVISDSLISLDSTIGFAVSTESAIDVLYIQTISGLSDQTSTSGLNIPLSSAAASAADFDNDMDMDIYVANSSAISNQPNILFDNNGDGTFSVVPDAAGAGGTSKGKVSSLCVADFDKNGFPDIFICNGEGRAPGGPSQLFRNSGNSNNWIQIELEGTISNRDGIGASVYLTAGGVTQLRSQKNGMHRYAQNSKLIHFGLASNLIVDEVVVHWPSGVVQTLTGLAVNQILHIKEPGLPECSTPFVETRAKILSDTQVVLHWDSVPGAVQYLIQGTRLSDNRNKKLGSTDTLRLVTGLEPGELYAWRIIARCTSDTSEFSCMNYFSTAQDISLAAGDTLVMPDGTEVSSSGLFEWHLSTETGCDSAGAFQVMYTADSRHVTGEQSLIFPNPVADNFSVVHHIQKRMQLTLEIFTSDGQLVYSEHKELDVGQHSWTVNAHEFPTGVLFLLLRGQDYFESYHLVKQN